jgi:hypothetical protein
VFSSSTRPRCIGVDVGAVVIEEIALNLRLPGRIQKCILVGPKIRIIELNVRVISDVACLRGCKRKKVLAQRFFMSRPVCPDARRVAQFAPRPSL